MCLFDLHQAKQAGGFIKNLHEQTCTATCVHVSFSSDKVSLLKFRFKDGFAAVAPPKGASFYNFVFLSFCFQYKEKTMSENSSLCSLPVYHHCCIIYTSLSSIKAVLILFLSTFVLYLGVQRWRQQRSCKTWSHADIFTYHQAVMDLLWLWGFFCRVVQDYFNLFAVGRVGMYVALITFYGEIMFHTLTCVERYVAVVHPVIYRGLRNTWGVRIRNIGIGCVWVLCLVFICMNVNTSQLIPLYCILVVAMLVTSFCSLMVLHVLVRPGPGGGGGQTDRSKHRAFCTIAVISGSQWLWFVGLLVSTALTKSTTLNQRILCTLEASAAVFNLPSSSVLPLLFLHRAGKLSRNCFGPG